MRIQREDVPRLQHEEETEPHEHGDPEDDEDRPRAYGNDAHLGGRHAGHFAPMQALPGFANSSRGNSRLGPARRLT